jgi:hypothetical protein
MPASNFDRQAFDCVADIQFLQHLKVCTMIVHEQLAAAAKAAAAAKHAAVSTNFVQPDRVPPDKVSGQRVMVVC